ncbi:MAG TPA: 2-C-methyl-D-erythritol 4-phosphate cytidylyltransferase [bacterium]|nr:2-C-methyl-D-erythritol 4-phosphate cytidylyltransferase [bacterium]
MKVVAVILAGGTGSRFGGDLPKQFEKIGERTIIEHSVAAFDDHPQVDEVVVVIHPDHVEHTKKLLSGFSKVKAVIHGGQTRSLSSFAGINFFKEYQPDTKILIHDAARPFVSKEIITNVILALDTNNAVNVALSVPDTVIEIDNSGKMKNIPERSTLKLVQTPQGFILSVIRMAYETAFKDPGFAATDDCGVVFNYLKEVGIFIIEGEPKNIKITTRSDLGFGRNFLVDK